MNKPNITASLQKALQWVRCNTLDEKGIVITTKQRIPYPEVTGYFIPTLINAGEYQLARQYAEFLLYIQRPNGSFAGPDGREYIFDSGQALRGLVAASKLWPEYKAYAKRTADYIVSSMKTNGQLPAIYGKDIPEAVHVFVLPALLEAANFFHDSRYKESTQRACSYYKKSHSTLDEKYLTHFLAYIVDGFIDMGESVFVKPIVKKIFSRQRRDGSISAYPHVSWVCSVGLAQLAIIAHKLNMGEQSHKAIAYLMRVQNKSGGFWGSYGLSAKYFPKEEISWANKFFIDALCMKDKGLKKTVHDPKPLNDKEWHKAMVEQKVEELAVKILKNDYPVWIKPLILKTAPEESVAELGSGTGELSAILSLYAREVHLLDYSHKSIDYAKSLFGRLRLKAKFYPTDILKPLPLATASVDWVFSSGVLEHFTDEEIVRILKECRRVCRKGVICLVPNARSVFYRVGKFDMEKRGTWKYGLEKPKFTMVPYLRSAGFKKIEESSIGTYHALEFWGKEKFEIKEFYNSLDPEELQALDQGYLLITSGEKHA